eukprot:scaffold77484_cov48-Phaeocystis_antarctica.AAC.2
MQVLARTVAGGLCMSTAVRVPIRIVKKKTREPTTLYRARGPSVEPHWEAAGSGSAAAAPSTAAKKEGPAGPWPWLAAWAKAASAAGLCLARHSASSRLGSSPMGPEGW